MGNTETKHHQQPQQKVEEKKEEIKKEIKINGESDLIKSNKIVEQFQKHLPKEFKEKDWNLIYSTKQKGKNIQLFDQCVHGMGANIIFVKSISSEHIFGAFVSQSWKLSTDFYGDSSTFLFSISEKDEILYTYKPSSYNNNFQYFNYGSKWNKFNGIGIGGLMKYFQFSIDEDFQFGKTMPKLMTFPNCPILCHSSSASNKPITEEEENLIDQKFEIDLIEVFSFPLTKEQILDLEYEKQNRDARLDGIDENINNFLLSSAGIKKDEARKDAFWKKKFIFFFYFFVFKANCKPDGIVFVGVSFILFGCLFCCSGVDIS